MSMLGLCLIALLSPLLAGIIIGLLNKSLNPSIAHTLAILAVFFSFAASGLLLKMTIANPTPISLPLYTWGSIGNLHFTLGFLIDTLTTLMMCVVSFVSLMVHIYTVAYMHKDPGYQRFFSYIALFTFGMLSLVAANNFLQLYFGWEMVGLMSYLLIGFWFNKESANVASLKAFLINRIGDLGFLLGIAGIAYHFGSLDYLTVFEHAPGVLQGMISLGPWQFSVASIICLGLFIGAMGKSAQMPLHVWLPDSMEGPTPISALIHAATMVTAGVFMIARLSPLFEFSDTVLTLILVIGTLTTLFTGILGIVQNDIKRIVAYSTLSQLGLMMMAMGVSAYSLGIFHLMTHAFFKALLFLGAGACIIAMHHEQNIWKMGNLRKYLPITYWTMLLGSLALIGFPFFSGFYSKDLIIEALSLSTLPFANVAYWIAQGGVFITALYTFRLFFVVFHGKARFSHEEKLHPVSWTVNLPLCVLGVFSIIAGALFIKPMFQGFFKDSIKIFPNHPSFSILQMEFKGFLEMGLEGLHSLSFVLGLAGIVVAWGCYVKFANVPSAIINHTKLIYKILQEKYGFDALYQGVIVVFVRRIGDFFFRISDQFLIDGIVVNGSARTVRGVSRLLKNLQTGYLFHYAFAMIIGFLVFILWLGLK